MQDEVLIKTLRKDPNMGIPILIEQYIGLLYTVIKGKLLIPPFTEEDIEDCLSDTFIEFYYGLSKYNLAKGSVKSWLCNIARNKAIDLLRKQYAKSSSLPPEEATQQPNGTCPEDLLLRQEEQEQLQEALQSLSKTDKEIILQKYYFCQPSKEIAKRLDMTVSNVDTRTHRAIEKLRKYWR